MQAQIIATARWWNVFKMGVFSALLGGLDIGAPRPAWADITYYYTGAPFTLSAPNCVQTTIPLHCVTGQVTGSVTFNIPAGFTGSLYGGADITAFRLTASGTDVTNVYPDNSGFNTPFSVLDAFTFRNGAITGASMFTRGDAVQGNIYPFNGPIIDIGTGYGGDVSATTEAITPMLWGYSITSGTWSLTPNEPPTSAHIYFASPTGTIDVTGKTETVAVGQPIQLSAEPAGSAQSQPWLVPGNTVGGFTVAGKIAAPCNGTTCAPGETVAANFTNKTGTTFYWIAPGNYAVEYQGSTGTVKGTFNVVGPDASSVSVAVSPPNAESPGGVHIDLPSTLSFGYDPGVPGISFHVAITKPVASPGNFVWTQLIDYDIVIATNSNGVQTTCEAAPRGGLDHKYPYPSAGIDYTNDTPSLQLYSTYEEEERVFAASMYLMWQPSGIPGSIPVPLGSVQVHRFVGNAKRISTLTNTWMPEPGAAQEILPAPFNFALTYPKWTAVAAGGGKPPCG